MPLKSSPRARALIAVFAVLSAVLIAYVLKTVAGKSAGESTDYTQDYLSARALAAGESVYAPLSEATIGVTDNPRTRVNDHPPLYIIVLAPLALLSHDAAHFVLAAVNLLAVVGAGLLLGSARGWGAVGGFGVVVLILLHPGTGVGCVHGNISSLLLALIVVGWWASRSQRSTLAGVCIGLAAAFKLFPLLLLLAFLMTRDWRGGLVAGCVVVGSLTASAAVVGADDALTYATKRAPENARTFVPSAFNLSVAGVAHRTFGEPDPNTPWLERAAVRPEWVPVVLWSLRGVVLVLVAWGFWRGGWPTSADRVFALLLPAMLLLSPLTWLHALPLVALTVAYLAPQAHTRPRQAALGVCLLALMVRDLSVGMWLMRPDGTVPWWGNFVMLAPTWGLFGVLVLVALWRPKS